MTATGSSYLYAGGREATTIDELRAYVARLSARLPVIIENPEFRRSGETPTAIRNRINAAELAIEEWTAAEAAGRIYRYGEDC
jgi:hypothetical protein